MSTDRSIRPAVTGFGILTLPPCRRIRVSDRVDLYVIRSGQVPLNRITVLADHGMSGCFAGIPGSDIAYRTSAAMLPSLMAEGSTGLFGADFAERLDFEGATLTHTCNSITSGLTLLSSDHTTTGLLPLLADVLAEPRLDADSFDAARTRYAQMRAASLASLPALAAEGAESRFYGPGHPSFVLPAPDDFSKSSYDDLRRYHSEVFSRSHFSVFASGRIEGELRQGITDFCRTLTQRLVGPQRPSAPIIPAMPDAPYRNHISVADAEQTAVSVAIPVAIGRHDSDYSLLRAAVTALGGYFGSRLMTNIRERKGLTYGINAALKGVPEGTYVTIDAQCRTGSAQLVIDEIDSEIRRLASSPMDNDELQRLSGHMYSALASILDNQFSIADHYMGTVRLLTPDDYFERQQTMLRQLTARGIADITRRYILDAPKIIVTAGPDLQKVTKN